MSVKSTHHLLLHEHGFGRRLAGRPSFFWAAVVLLLPLSLFGGVVVGRWTHVPVPAAVAPLVTFVLIFLGLWQWGEQRQEVSLDRYFDRLELANKYRLEHFAKFLETDHANVGQVAEDRQRALDQFYIFYLFTEIDTLEYVARRYRLGHVKPELAGRAVRTFENRCRQSPTFWVAANTLTAESKAYPLDIKPVICAILKDTAAEMRSKLRYAGAEPNFDEDIARSLRWADEGEIYRRSIEGRGNSTRGASGE